MPETKDMHKALFANLIMMLSTSAMQQLGKVMDPATGKTEVSLEGAQFTIDVLEMLQARTAGNLDDDEARMLKDVLASLQMNYVETANDAGADDSATEPAVDATPPAERETSADNASDNKEPRFHKSYGE